MIKKALIFGITGQDGSYLTSLLVSKNYEVHGITRNLKKKNFFFMDQEDISKIKLHELQIFDYNQVHRLINTIKPDEVYNLSGITAVSKSFEIPNETFKSIFDLNLNLLEVLKTLRNFKYYYACSSECFGETLSLPADENTPFKPQSPYAVGKASSFMMLEVYKKAYKIFACSGILFNHESPKRPENFVTKKIISTAFRIFNGSNEKLELGDLNVVRDWGWAPEYVKAMWLMLQQEYPENFVIATGESHSLKEFVIKVFNNFGLDWRKHVKINRSFVRPYELKKSFANPEKAKNILLWEAETKFNEMIDKLTLSIKNDR